MAELFTLSTATAQLDLVPKLGGSIARLDVGGRPVLRPWHGYEDDLFSLACNVLVPFSNRISGTGINWGGSFYAIGANLTGEK